MGFLTPQNLVYGLSLGLLVLIYLRSRARPTLEVSSLMLFEEASAPVASVRHLRSDLPFWLELSALTLLTLALAGFYVRTVQAPGHGRSHALVFDLGAGMSAREAGGTRLDQARREALEIIRRARPGDEFSIIGYALEAHVRRPPSSNLSLLRNALDELAPMAVAARAAALRAALMRARGASEIYLFADRPPASGILAEAASSTRVNFRQVGSGDANLAIVSLDPGIPGSTQGRVVVRNFSARPHPCELEIDLGGEAGSHQNLMLAPREQTVVPFGPLKAGGLVHAQILTQDAIEADNIRYAFAPMDRAERVLVVSREPSVRDDLARVLLAIDPNFQIEAVDPAKYHPAAGDAGNSAQPFELVVVHDGARPQVNSASILFIYPPQGHPLPPSGIAVQETLKAADHRPGRSADSGNREAAPLGATRIIKLPEWMEPIARGAGSGHPSIPVVAMGSTAAGRIGVLAFDVRDHLLLDPDHLGALIVTIDLLKRLTAPRDVQIVATGAYLSVAAEHTARVTQPDGKIRLVKADQWGRARIQPLQAGRYKIESGQRATEVYANYYDAAESDLGAKPQTEAHPPAGKTAAARRAHPAREVHPLVLVLCATALLVLMLESILLIRHAGRWRMRHV